MVKFNISINSNQFMDNIKQIQNGFRDMKPALRKIRSMQLKEIDEAFKVGGKNIIGKPWERLKPSTIRRRIAGGFTTRILERTGKMKRNFKNLVFTKTQIIIMNLTKYFPDHQIGKGNIPRRQMMGHSPKMVKKSKEFVENYINKILKKGTR